MCALTGSIARKACSGVTGIELQRSGANSMARRRRNKRVSSSAKSSGVSRSAVRQTLSPSPLLSSPARAWSIPSLKSPMRYRPIWTATSPVIRDVEALRAQHDRRVAAGMSAPTEHGRRNVSGLKFSTSKPVSDRHHTDQVRDRLTCKSRPKDNRPRSGGAGKRRFVPWCS